MTPKKLQLIRNHRQRAGQLRTSAHVAACPCCAALLDLVEEDPGTTFAGYLLRIVDDRSNPERKEPTP